MGADDGLPVAALIDDLLAHPQRFDLFQAISLLERAAPTAQPLGHGDGSGEAIRLSGFVSLAFEPSDVRAVTASGGAPDAAYAAGEAAPFAYTLSTPVLTLAGANGPLPMPFAEMVLQRRAARDHATTDLLDIFNHRFLSFLYRSRKKHAWALNGLAPDASTLAACLDALSHLGVRSRVRGPHGERLWLRHAGLLGGAPRSMTGLLALLSDRLGLDVRGAQFVGSWREIDARDSLRVGSSVSRLGTGQVLGRRVWDQAGGIRIEFMNLSRAAFASLLPHEPNHELAAWLIGRYVQQDFDVQFVLHLAKQEASCAAGGPAAARLGWTSWLGGAGAGAAPAPVRLSMRGTALH
jgi:type VI secretion system protein ImpH